MSNSNLSIKCYKDLQEYVCTVCVCVCCVVCVRVVLVSVCCVYVWEMMMDPSGNEKGICIIYIIL